MRLAILAIVVIVSGCGITEATVWRGDSALSFDGSDCVVATGPPEALGLAITVEAWVTSEQYAPDDRGVIASMGEAGALWASPYQTGFGKPGDYTTTGWETGHTIYDGERHHVASVWSADQGGAIYFDGYKSGYSTNWRDVPGFDTIRIGCAPGGENHFAGTVDEVRISSTARYTLTAFQPPTEPFEADGDTIALYHFDLGLGDRVLEARDQYPGEIRGAEWVDGLMTPEEPGEDTGW